MSAVDPAVVRDAADRTRPTRGSLRRMVSSEVRLVFGRRRNQALLVLVALIPLLLGIVIKVNGGVSGSGGPQFLDQVTRNGLFLVFAGIEVSLGFLLPLVVSVAASDSVAGEAGSGTLRYLLLVPVSRPRLLLVKAAGALVYAATAVMVIGLMGLATGAALFPVGRFTLLSGDSVSLGSALLRALAVVAYVFLVLVGLVALGLLASTLTEVPIAAAAVTIVSFVVLEIVDAVPQVHVLHPYLLTHHWNDFGEILRGSPRLQPLLAGLVVSAAWSAIATSLAYARFTAADITA